MSVEKIQYIVLVLIALFAVYFVAKKLLAAFAAKNNVQPIAVDLTEPHPDLNNLAVEFNRLGVVSARK